MRLETASGPFDLTPEILQALKRQWPTKDVDGELSGYALWLIRHPKSRPVKIFRGIDNWLRKAPDLIRPEPRVGAWWMTEQRTLNQGAALGMKPHPGESLASFRDRISAALAPRSA